MKHLTLTSRAGDVILSRPSSIVVFERLGIPLGVQEYSLGEVAQHHGVSAQLLLSLLEITVGSGAARLEQLGQDDILPLVDYLLHSHAFYSEEALPRIVLLIERIAETLEGDQQSMLRLVRSFLGQYTQEVEAHFSYERDVAFPYIKARLRDTGCEAAAGTGYPGENTGYCVGDYLEQHSHVEEKLQDLRNLLVRYLDMRVDPRWVRELYLAIHSLGEDISTHTHIENELLVPLVLQLEGGKCGCCERGVCG